MPWDSLLHRRGFLCRIGAGALGLTLADFLAATPSVRGDQPTRTGHARSCIVLYCWGGMSHHETWDLKPDAPAEYRGEFRPIATAVPGILVGTERDWINGEEQGENSRN